MSIDFPYNSSVINALEASLSVERLASYLNRTGQDKERALHLYVWNTEVSAALYAPLQGLEVALRNAMHRELTGVYGATWFDNQATRLAVGEVRRVSQAKDSLARSRHAIVPARMVPELSFGFWVSLLGRGPQGRYENGIWRRALYHAFPNAKLKRKDAHNPLDRLRTLRNRIAHHEPIFQRDLDRDYQRIMEVIGWICADTAAWVTHYSTFRDTLSRRP